MEITIDIKEDTQTIETQNAFYINKAFKDDNESIDVVFGSKLKIAAINSIKKPSSIMLKGFISKDTGRGRKFIVSGFEDLSVEKPKPEYCPDCHYVIRDNHKCSIMENVF